VYIWVNGARLFFDTAGSSLAVEAERMAARRPLIVLHGGPGFDHTAMRPYFDRFADTHQVIYLDHRGNGRSGGQHDTWKLDQWGDDIAEFCNQLGLTRPIIFGQSFGGMVAQAYATRHPDGPEKLILSSTAARMRLEDTYAMMEKLGGADAAKTARQFWEDPNEQNIAAYIKICMPLYNPPGDVDIAAAMRKRAIMRFRVMFDFVAGEQRTMDFREALANVKCPTLVVAGALDPITPVVCAQEIIESLPEGVGRLEVFENCGHGAHRDRPDEAEAMLRAFLKD
jgi:proline-specific peptidase